MQKFCWCFQQDQRAARFLQMGKTFQTELIYMCKKISFRWSNQAGKIILTANQLAWYLALDEI